MFSKFLNVYILCPTNNTEFDHIYVRVFIQTKINKYVQRVAFRIELSLERHRDCNFRFKPKSIIRAHHLTYGLIEDQSYMANGMRVALTTLLSTLLTQLFVRLTLPHSTTVIHPYRWLAHHNSESKTFHRH